MFAVLVLASTLQAGTIRPLTAEHAREVVARVNAGVDPDMRRPNLGSPWLTNERIRFSGPRKTFAPSYSKITSFEATSEGLRIVKQGRETPYLVRPDDFEIPCAVISYLLNR